jgi:hypothetical protein
MSHHEFSDAKLTTPPGNAVTILVRSVSGPSAQKPTWRYLSITPYYMPEQWRDLAGSSRQYVDFAKRSQFLLTYCLFFQLGAVQRGIHVQELGGSDPD